MAASSKKEAVQEKQQVVFCLNGLWISYAHTLCAGVAFLASLILGCLLHYEKIVQNEHFGYPQEWFPSVSATIGDHYPERSVYQLMIALTSGPRFLLVGLTYILTSKPGSKIPLILLTVGVLRTFTCGGWTYVTSTDDHDWHDVFMISYIVLTLPWTVLRTISTPRSNRKAKNYRIIVASTFFGLIVPLIYFFIQHKVHKIPGAYTIYAFFEWALVGLDVAFDAGTAYDFPQLQITVVDTNSACAQKTDIAVLRDCLHLRQGPPIIGFLVSVVNWFVWWSVITSVGAMIWYFPLWYMGISGYEAFALTLISPFVLAIPPLRKLFARFPQLAFAGQVLGVGAYWVVSPPDRMMWVGVGAGFASIAFGSTFSSAATSSRPGIVALQASAFIVGLVLTIVARIPCFTNNPLWPIMKPSIGGINHWGIAIGIAGAACAGVMVPDRTAAPIKAPSSSGVLLGFGVGSWLFLVMTFITDVSNLPLWVWEGFPLRGPSPIPHGVVILFVIAAGTLWSHKSKFALSWPGMVIFNIAMVGISQLKNWPGFAAGLVVAFYLAAYALPLLKASSSHCPGKVFGIGMLFSVLYMFAETWTVAYAFVPGGPLLRERTWLVLLIEQIGLTLGIVAARRSFKFSAAASKVSKLLSWALVISLAFACLFTFNRLQHPIPKPVHPESRALTAGIWTVHFGLDNGLWASETRMADLIRDAELDVIGLLESDTQRIIGGHRDITQRISEELGFYADYGPSANKHTWGVALLSKFPIVHSEHHLTPSPVGELAPAIHATLDVYGEYVDVVVFHSGQEEDVEDRRLQTGYVSDVLSSIGDRPALLLSYLVTRPLEGNYNVWVSEHTGMHDIDPSDDDRWCEYILYKNLKRTGYARISRDTITDTELQVGRFQVFEKPNYSNTRVSEEKVEQGLRFPSIFRGEGVRGHRYHVFDEPRYFA